MICLDTDRIEAKLTTGILFAIMAAIAFGVARVFAGVGLPNMKPLHGSVVSLVVSWLLALVICLILQFKALVSLSLVNIGWLAITGLLSFALGRGFSFLGIKYIGVSRSITIYASYPVFTIALAIPFLKEKVSLPLIIGVLLIIGGITLLVSEPETEKKVTTGVNRLLGIGFSLASAMSYGANMVLIRWVVSTKVNPLVATTVSIFFGMLILLTTSGRHITDSIKSSHRATAFFALSGVAMTIGSIASYTSLSLAPAVMVSALGATSPLFAILGTYMFLQKLEKVTYQVVIGSLMVVGGGVLVTVG